MKIYTRTGDDGTTGLFGGGRVSKNSLRVDAYGTVDELNAYLGLVRAHKPSAESDSALQTVQDTLFHLGADLATPLDSDAKWVTRITEPQVAWLEQHIDEMTAKLPELRAFILPGGTFVSSHIHVARTVCRRAERLTVALAEAEPLNAQALIYLNRLSDWLFTLARFENMQAGVEDVTWSAR